MIRRSLSMGMMLALAVPLLALPVGAATPVPNAEVVPQLWLIGTPSTAPVHGAVVVREAANHVSKPTVEFTLIGLRPQKHHFIVLSTQSCMEDFVLGFPYGFTSNGHGQRSGSYKVALEDVLISSLRSVRVLRGSTADESVALTCGNLRAYDKVDQEATTTHLRAHDAGSSAAPGSVTDLIIDVSLTIFRGPTAKGIIVAGQSGDDQIRVRAVITGPADGGPYPSRWTFVVGTAGCGHTWSKSERAGKLRVDIDAKGSGWFNGTTPSLLYVAAGDVNGDGVVDAADYVAWRIKAAGGRSVGCFGVDAKLAKHQS